MNSRIIKFKLSCFNLLSSTILFVMTLRQKLPSYGKVDITVYKCSCNMLILLKFRQNTRFEMRNPINAEFIFCCVTF